MAGLRDLKRRIKSVQGMRKVTRAMQMVSAAKMRKAQSAVVASRTYVSLAWDLIENLSSKVTSSNPLLQQYPKAKKIGVVVLGSNRGLVGSLNSNLASKLKELVPSTGSGHNQEVIAEVVVYGKKAKALAQRMKQSIVADFDKIEKNVSTQDIYPLAQYIADLYATGEYQKIVLVYNHFVSTLTQKPTAKQLLPFLDTKAMQAAEANEDEQDELDSEYIFEPTPQEVLEHLLPRILESQIYQAILESDASEHSARMVMMKNATDAAGDLVDDYTLTYNQLRQNKITIELAEITAGKIALE